MPSPTIEYFTFDLETRTAGLLRRTVDDVAKTETLEAVKGGEWVDDPSLIRFFSGVGGDQLDLVPLSDDEAHAVALELGVTLEGGVRDA